jgi:hypothetical protein
MLAVFCYHGDAARGATPSLFHQEPDATGITHHHGLSRSHTEEGLTLERLEEDIGLVLGHAC